MLSRSPAAPDLSEPYGVRDIGDDAPRCACGFRSIPPDRVLEAHVRFASAVIHMTALFAERRKEQRHIENRRQATPRLSDGLPSSVFPWPGGPVSSELNWHSEKPYSLAHGCREGAGAVAGRIGASGSCHLEVETPPTASPENTLGSVPRSEDKAEDAG